MLYKINVASETLRKLGIWPRDKANNNIVRCLHQFCILGVRSRSSTFIFLC